MTTEDKTSIITRFREKFPYVIYGAKGEDGSEVIEQFLLTEIEEAEKRGAESEVRRISVGVAHLYLKYPEIRMPIKSILYDERG